MKYWDSVRCLAGYELYIVFDDNKVYEISSMKPDGMPRDVLPNKFAYIAEFLKDNTKQPMLLEAWDDLDFDWATPFMIDVYKALISIPCGTTASYKELAALSGHPKAVRAVGTAMGKNRFLIVLPCHRITASNGLGGFSSGLDMKKSLLKCEGKYDF